MSDELYLHDTRILQDRIRALQAELKKWLDAYPLSPNELRDALQFRVKGLEAELRDARIDAAKERSLSEVHLNAKRKAEAALESYLGTVTEEREAREKAEARVEQIEADHSLGINWKEKLDKAEADLAAAREEIDRLVREVPGAKRNHYNRLESISLKRAAGRECGGEPATTTKASGRTEPQMVVGTTDAAAKSAARHTIGSHPMPLCDECYSLDEIDDDEEECGT